MRKVAIISAKRTPQGRFLGSLSKLNAVDLAVAAGKSAISDCNRTELPDEIDETIIGNVLSAGQGMNIARQIAIRLGLPKESPAFTVNMMCASGMKAIMLGCDAIRNGSANLVLCGGSESMSQAPYLLPRVRAGLKFGDSMMLEVNVKNEDAIALYSKMGYQKLNVRKNYYGYGKDAQIMKRALGDLS